MEDISQEIRNNPFECKEEMIGIQAFGSKTKESFLKRSFDIVFAGLALIVSFPLWIIISLAIYIEDPGPVYFIQKRVGKRGKLFQVIKFRTMKYCKNNKYLDIDLEEDTRVTRMGKVLRAIALDELPQLINILKGDMSIVGPRTLPFEIEDGERSRYKNIEEIPGYYLRSQVCPGLTGLAQVYAPKDASRKNKFRYDNLYVRNMSFLLDLKLIFRSFWITFKGKWESRQKK